MLLADNETKVDLLNNEAIAATIITLVRDRPTAGDDRGSWRLGASKSSMLEVIEAGLGGQGGIVCVKFNGWRFQGFEDATIALIEGIVTRPSNAADRSGSAACAPLSRAPVVESYSQMPICPGFTTDRLRPG